MASKPPREIKAKSLDATNTFIDSDFAEAQSGLNTTTDAAAETVILLPEVDEEVKPRDV